MSLRISHSLFMPKPRQSGQKPKGELKENKRGSTLGTEKPHLGHVCLSDNNLSLSPFKIISKPLEKLRHVSIDSKTRLLTSGLTIKRSTTISILCFLFFSKAGTSSSVNIFPSTRTRLKPSFLILSKTSFCVPFSA